MKRPKPNTFGSPAMAERTGLSIVQIRRLVREGDIEAPPVDGKRYVWCEADIARVKEAAERRGWMVDGKPVVKVPKEKRRRIPA